MSFIRWQVHRGVLEPPSSARAGSPWWRAVNERLLRDGCESVALTGHLPGPPTSSTVELWMRFIRRQTSRTWYRAHNASVVEHLIQISEVVDAISPLHA